MATFDPAFQRTMNFEGITLENVPGDPGGLTFCGIARNPNPEWAGWATIDKYLNSSPDLNTARQLALDDEGLMGLVEQFYLNHIWNANNLGQLIYQELAIQVYDALVNCGSRAVKWLQTLVGANPDGILGPISLKLCNGNADPAGLVQDYLTQRKNYYNDLAAREPQMAKFLQGWLNRCVLSDQF
jgi:lysozyme family protein